MPKTTKLLPIKYASGSAQLTARSTYLIDKHILSVLKKNENAVIEIGSHTDSQGKATSNMKLSERRAKGVKQSRLIAVGYGETKLLNDCDCLLYTSPSPRD